MPVFAQYNYDEVGINSTNSALSDGGQVGERFNGARHVGVRTVLDDVDDKVKFSQSNKYQRSVGTPEVQFSQAEHNGNGPNTVLSRDGIGETPAGFRIDATPDAPFRTSHKTSSHTQERSTAGIIETFVNPMDTPSFAHTETVCPCFTPGTMIATPKGEIPIERLKVGDRVITRDNGIQEIRWKGGKKLDWADLTAHQHLQPIMIRRGSLGHDLPERDMMVSPNHRVLVANDRTALYFDEHEVLVAAKHLVGIKGVFCVESIGTGYIHILFDKHEVVLSDGAWTESFQPGDYTLKGMGNSQRNEIFEIFPELKTRVGVDSYLAARRSLTKHEAKQLVR